uniref:Uncharacterized protein n=1 Tax=Anopheles melas TaxID=34690 RepID=A0A182TUN8_9DIPT
MPTFRFERRYWIELRAMSRSDAFSPLMWFTFNQVRPLDVVVLGNGCRQSLGTLGRAAIRSLLLLLLLLLARVCTWSTLLLECALLCLGLIVTRLNEDLLQLRLLYDDREFIMMEERIQRSSQASR